MATTTEQQRECRIATARALVDYERCRLAEVMAAPLPVIRDARYRKAARRAARRYYAARDALIRVRCLNEL